MWTYILRRLLAFIPTVFLSVTLIFLFTRLLPGNPVWALIGDQSVSAEKIDEVVRQMGYDRPILVQYLEWLPRVFTGEFGHSVFYKEAVLDVILDRFPVTFNLAFLSLVVTVVVAVPIGILSATRRNTWLDHLGMATTTIWISLPAFWLGFLFIIFFSVGLRWFPSSGYRDLSFGFDAWFSRLVLPVLSLSLAHIALLVRMTRSSMLDVLSNEYIVTARAKGLSESIVIYKHALRNAFVSIITVIGLIFALNLGGSIIIENVYALPGLGQLVATAALRRDYAIIEGSMLYFILVALIVNLVIDISYSLINPRIRYG
ncbi:MAG: ABC transporter permease [Alphaproteobacteria bacterium]|nr:ABC transporter permease [Alphaproteobacteria bacterium]